MSKFYITTAIAYVNGRPHMGHALEFVLTDAIARYRRMIGDETFFLTGTDEHGIKIFNTAKDSGKEVQAFVDEHAQVFKSLERLLDLSNDDFIRTSDRERHWPACQKLWKKLEEKGDIYEQEYEGIYCEGCEAFLSPRDLTEDGVCPIHQKAPQMVKEKNYFFRLSNYSKQIESLIESDQLRITPSFRKAEILNMVKEGLVDVSFSRPRSVLPWGVPVPGDEDQVMYVWCDALTNYISAIGYADESDGFKKWWPADCHVIGKDIVRFHAAIWIGMLISAGLPLPRSILVHGFITHNGEKMSKSLGNVVDPLAVTEQYGIDALRYYLLREIPSGRDGDFSDRLFIERYNTDLANNLGNLVNRVHTLVTRNSITDFTFDQSAACRESVDETWSKYRRDMGHYDVHEAIFHIFRLVDFANKQMEEEKPWSLVKTDPERARAVLSGLLELIRHLTMMLYPIIPDACVKIRLQLGLPESFDLQSEQPWGAFKSWKTLGEAQILFPRLES